MLLEHKGDTAYTALTITFTSILLLSQSISVTIQTESRAPNFSSDLFLKKNSGSKVCCFRHFLKTGFDLLFCRLDIPKCPLDGEEILRDQYFRDRCCEREVHNLQCFCRYRDRGCDWKGELGYLKVGLKQSLGTTLTDYTVFRDRSLKGTQ